MHVQALIMTQIPASTPSNTTFITGQSLSATLRNDGGSYWTGFKFTVAGAPITVTHLGRWKASGDSNVHDMQLFSYGTNPAPISGGQANVDMSQSADPDGYVYVALVTPQTLSASTVYQIGSQEVNGVDHFYQNDTTVTSTAVASVDQGFYYINATPGSGWGWTSGAGTTYGPVSFKYHL